MLREERESQDREKKRAKREEGRDRSIRAEIKIVGSFLT